MMQRGNTMHFTKTLLLDIDERTNQGNA